MTKKIISLCTLAMVLLLSAHAQTEGWKYKAAIKPVAASGFYNLEITPAINAHLRTDYHDLRIVNDSGKWVPHVLMFPNLERTYQEVSWMMQFKQTALPDGNTAYVVEGQGEPISNLELSIRNTAAERFAEITGSDDGKTWYSISDSILIQPLQASAEKNASFTLKFPKVNYKQFRLVIYNKGKAPFNIIRITNQNESSSIWMKSLQPAVENPPTSLFQTDIGQNSYVRVVQPAAHHFDQIQIALTGVHYFNRRMEIYVPENQGHSFTNPGKLVKTFNLSNNSTLNYRLDSKIKTDTCYLVIRNEDNLPLKITSVKTYAEYGVASTYLEAGKLYSLLLDNPQAIEPKYDLRLNGISVKDLPELTVDTLVFVGPSASTAPKSNQWVLWLIIALAGVVLAFFAWKLLKELNKNTA